MVFLFRPNRDLGAMVAGSRGVRKFTQRTAQDVVDKAREIFLRQVRHTHPITPPPYADSFFVRPTTDGIRYMAGNSDPAAIMVEFGAHPGGGETKVLAYHPLAGGLEAVHATR